MYLAYDADTGRELAVKRVLVKGGDVERKALRKVLLPVSYLKQRFESVILFNLLGSGIVGE